MKNLIPDFENIENINKTIQTYKSSLEKDIKEKILKIQNLLRKCDRSNDSIKLINSIKQNFDYKFGNEINNTIFIDYMNKSLPTLFSWSKARRKQISDFFNQIGIDDFLYIPMLNDDLLSKFKKHLFLGIINNQLIPMRNEVARKFVLYTNKDFNEKAFDYSLEIELNRDENFLKYFCKDYSNYSKIKIDIKALKKYIFSNVIIDAYLLTSKEIFGKDATFVNRDNIKKALEIKKLI